MTVISKEPEILIFIFFRGMEGAGASSNDPESCVFVLLSLVEGFCQLYNHGYPIMPFITSHVGPLI